MTLNAPSESAEATYCIKKGTSKKQCYSLSNGPIRTHSGILSRLCKFGLHSGPRSFSSNRVHGRMAFLSRSGKYRSDANREDRRTELCPCFVYPRVGRP